MKNKKFIVLKLTVLFIFLVIGLFIRLKVPHETLTGNTVAFYFSRAEHLERTGEYLKEDTTTFAGHPYKENYPPFPAYFAVPLYKLAKIFGVDFSLYISYFPVIIYLMILVGGFFIVKDFFGFDSAVIFSILLSITPVAIRATQKNYYTEEALGIFFIICSIYYVCKSKQFDFNFYMAAFFLTLLALTWQVFLLLFFAVGILALINFRNKRLLLTYSLLIFLPFLIGHITSVYLIGIDYSPIYMIKESYITIKEGHEDYFKIAFNRNDLETPGTKNVAKEFGYLPTLLIMMGFITLTFKLKYNKNRFLLIIGIIAASSFLQSTKFRYFASAPLLIIGAAGSDSIFNFFSLKKWQKLLILLPIIIVVFILIFRSYAAPSCSVSIDKPEKMEVGKYYPIVFTVKNNGFNPKCDNKSEAFGGIHIEFGNATILNNSVYPIQKKLPKYRVQFNDFNWFEAVIDCLRSDEEVKITAWIMPKNENVKLDYRCWLPKKYCWEKAPQGLRPQYSRDWRNEKCIVRHPNSGKQCDVNVYAGYFNRTDFHCISEDLHVFS